MLDAGENDPLFAVPDSIDGVPGFAELFRAGDVPVSVDEALPALPAECRQELSSSLRTLRAAAGRAVTAVGDGCRDLATHLGVTGPDRIMVGEVSFFGVRDPLARMAFADRGGIVDLSADTTPTAVWRTAVTLFDICRRQLQVIGERDQVIVLDLDRRLSACRSIRALFDATGEPVGDQGLWTSVLYPRATYDDGEAPNPVEVGGPAFLEATSRIEGLLLEYGVRFVQWPDADVRR